MLIGALNVIKNLSQGKYITSDTAEWRSLYIGRSGKAF